MNDEQLNKAANKILDRYVSIVNEIFDEREFVDSAEFLELLKMRGMTSCHLDMVKELCGITDKPQSWVGPNVEILYIWSRKEKNGEDSEVDDESRTEEQSLRPVHGAEDEPSVSGQRQEPVGRQDNLGPRSGRRYGRRVARPV